jgi:hypothetical protein
MYREIANFEIVACAVVQEHNFTLQQSETKCINAARSDMISAQLLPHLKWYADLLN